MLYKFDNLSAALDSLGYQQLDTSSVKIMKRDLTQEANSGNIAYRSDGVYLTIDGKEYKGYMYHKHPNIARYGFPKFHITECKTILEQRAGSRFDNNYFWENNNTVTLIDRGTHETHKDIELELCGNCRAKSRVDYTDTQGFFETLEGIMDNSDLEMELDIMGYPIKPINWQMVSKNYRIQKNYTCENPKCGIAIEVAVDRRFIHVHHKDGNKINCNISNLECLCVLCHSKQDERHIANFQKKRLLDEVKTFVIKYKSVLEKLGHIFPQ